MDYLPYPYMILLTCSAFIGEIITIPAFVAVSLLFWGCRLNLRRPSSQNKNYKKLVNPFGSCNSQLLCDDQLRSQKIKTTIALSC